MRIDLSAVFRIFKRQGVSEIGDACRNSCEKIEIFCADFHKFEAGTLIITKSSQITPNADFGNQYAFIVINDIKLNRIFLESRFNCAIVIQSNFRPSAILSIITDYSQSGNGEQYEALLNFFESANTVDVFLENAHKIAKNPMFVIDLGYNLIAKSTSDSNDDPLCAELLTSGTFCHETIKMFDTFGFIEDVANAENIVFLEHSLLKYSRCLGILTDPVSGKTFGSIILVFAENEKGNFNKSFFLNLCNFISLFVVFSEKFKEIEHVYYEKFIAEVISGAPSFQVNNSAIASNFYRFSKNFFFIAIFDFPDVSGSYDEMSSLRIEISRIYTSAMHFIYNSQLISFLTSEISWFCIDEEVLQLEKFLEERGGFVSLSDGFSNVYSFPVHFKNAMFTLNFSHLSGLDRRRISMYDDYRVLHHLSNLRETPEEESIFHPAIFSILKFNTKNSDVFSEKLCEFIQLVVSQNATLLKNYDVFGEFMDKFSLDLSNIETLYSVYLTLKVRNITSGKCVI